ncbi:MAG: hypothetical protein AAF907_00495 [Planctomycetota bacterium]
MAASPARRRRLLAQKKAARAERAADAAPAPKLSDDSEAGALNHAPVVQRSGSLDETLAALLPASTEGGREEPDGPAATSRWSAPLAPVGPNPVPLPEALPPRLDAAVQRLREDLLVAGGEAAALADEICARHRDRLREALGLPN